MTKLLLLLTILLAAPSQEPRPLSAIADDLYNLSLELRNRPTTLQVHAGESLPNALLTAKGGDTIVLDAGVKYVGPLTLTAKSGVVTIRSSAALPERRITPADTPLLATIASGEIGPAIKGTGAANWRFDGIQFEPTSSGTGEIIVLQDASNIYLDRILIVGGVNGQKRAIRGNGINITLTRSHIANIWAPGQDSQTFCAWDGAGPFTITDNFLEAASENVMFGGADSKSSERIPSDILVEGNLMSKPLAWKGTGKAVKNLFELKVGKRVVIRNNVFDTNYTDAQNGYAILIKSVNQDGTAPWSVTEDVLFENNIVRNTENGVNLLGTDYAHPSGQTTRVTIQHNDFQMTGIGFQIGGGVGELTITRNTLVNGWNVAQLYGTPTQNLVFTGNIANHNAYGIKGDGMGIGTPSLTAYDVLYTFANNVLLGGAGKGVYPATTYYDLASVPAGVEVGK